MYSAYYGVWSIYCVYVCICNRGLEHEKREGREGEEREREKEKVKCEIVGCGGGGGVGVG